MVKLSPTVKELKDNEINDMVQRIIALTMQTRKAPDVLDAVVSALTLFGVAAKVE